MIKIDHIELGFDRVLITQGELQICNGQITGVIGDSGSGKTTLLQEIALLGKCEDMNYNFDDISIQNINLDERMQILRQDICFVMQDVYLFENLNIIEVMKIYASFLNQHLNEDDVYKLLHSVNIQLDIYTPVAVLSGGEKQRLCIACGLLKNAKLFIFDEPFASLDKENVENIFKLIKELAYQHNKMVVISTHDQSIFEQFDIIYKIKNQRLLLIKGSIVESQSKLVKRIPFSFTSLMSYAHLNNSKYKWKNVCLCSLLSVIISLLIVIGNFSNSFQKSNGASLLSLMKNEVSIIRKDTKPMTVKQQSLLRSKLSDYEIYGDYNYEDIQGVTIRMFLENEKNNFQVLETISKNGSINNKSAYDSIYMSYSMYRKLNNSTQYQFIDDENVSLLLDASHILKPSDDNRLSIYIPYDEMIKYQKSKGADIGLQEVGILKVIINNIDDVGVIESKLTEDYQILHEGIFDTSIQIAQIMSKTSVNVFIIITLLLILVYKFFDILRVKKDMILLKISGIQNKYLVFLKMYQEGLFLFYNMIMTVMIVSLLSWGLGILVWETFIDMFALVFVWNVGMYIVLLATYTFMIFASSPAKLLRKNSD